ncbi:hypothetical protein [Micromonospora ureilytica]|nr:hypothetical protein OHB55_22460 [Micromonospora ureilytica]
MVGRTPQDALAEARERPHGVPRIWWVGPDVYRGLGFRPVGELRLLTF